MEISYEVAYEKACLVIGDLTVRLRLTDERLEAAQALIKQLVPADDQTDLAPPNSDQDA